jgi:hypothetical protein
MSNLAVKVPVTESERGWGRKIDDYMVCLSMEDAKAFTKEFNAKNTDETVPDWYMVVENEPIPMDLTDAQFKRLKKEKRIWLSSLKNSEK